MSPLLTTPAVAEEIQRLGAIDVVIGLPTAGATPTAAAAAHAARAALEGLLAGHSAVFVHADPTP